MTFAYYQPKFDLVKVGPHKWVERYIGGFAGAALDAATRRSIGAALMSLPYRIDFTHIFNAELRGDWLEVVDQPVDVEVRDVVITPPEGDDLTVYYSYASSIHYGLPTPSVATDTTTWENGDESHTPVFGAYQNGAVVNGEWGTYWSTSPWRTTSTLCARYEIVWVDPDNGGGFEVGDDYWIRFELGGEAGLVQAHDITCTKPQWWDQLYASSPSDASEMFLSIVHFWQTKNGMDATASWLEDTLGLPGGWPRVTLVMPYTTDGGQGCLVQQIDQWVTDSERLKLVLDSKAAEYPCAESCLPEFPAMVTAVQQIADQLGGDSTERLANAMDKIRETIEMLATLDVTLRMDSHGVVYGSRTGPTQEPGR